MKKITYYNVKNDQGSISLVNEVEATKLANSEFHAKVFGSKGIVETVSFNIFDDADSVAESFKKEISEVALQKLTDVEKYVLGLS